MINFFHKTFGIPLTKFPRNYSRSLSMQYFRVELMLTVEALKFDDISTATFFFIFGARTFLLPVDSRYLCKQVLLL